MLKIVRDDISRMKADALVNCASSRPGISAGVESALFAKGKRWLKEERAKLGVIGHGHAAITRGGGSLQCKWVIHAVGPYWEGGKNGELNALCNCYREVLTLAAKAKCKTLAIPLISAGNHGFPCDVVMSAAVGEISRFLSFYKMDICLVVYDWKAYVASGNIFGDIDNLLGNDYDTEQAIFQSYVDAIWPKRRTYEQIKAANAKKCFDENHAKNERKPSGEERNKALEDAVRRVGKYPKGYVGELRRLLTVKKLSTSAIYQGGVISKQVFFKVYHGLYKGAPDKDTLLKLSFKMRLTYEETCGFLAHAGLAFSPSVLRDQIVADYITRQDYDTSALDMALYSRKLPVLFCSTEDRIGSGK